MNIATTELVDFAADDRFFAWGVVVIVTLTLGAMATVYVLLNGGT